jgi:hypothetical protein
MATTIAPLLAWLVEFQFLYLHGLQKITLVQVLVKLPKITQVLLSIMGSVVLLTLGWSASGDVDHEKVCVCHTYCL